MKAAIIFLLMMFLIPADKQTNHGETETQAKDRYAVIARAITDEAQDDKQLTLFLLTIAKHESSFRKDIHSGKVKGDQGRSWGLFQMLCGRSPNAKVPGTKYKAKDIVGVDYKSTRQAANATGFHIRKFIKRCNGRPMCVFKIYGGVGKNPKPKTLKRLQARVRTYRLLQQKTNEK
jgi:hypothetical protein